MLGSMSSRDPTGAQRQSLWRRRRHLGTRVVHVEVSDLDLEAALNAGLLTDEESRDRAALSGALSRAFRRLLYGGTGKNS